MDILTTRLFSYLKIANAGQSALANPQPSMSSPTGIEIITKQIEFLEQANTNFSESLRSLTTSFNSFTTAINIFFGIFLIVVTIIGSIATFLGVRNISQSVEREVNKAISRKIEAKINYLEEVAGRESVLDQVSAIYLSPNSSSEPLAFKVLQRRIKTIKFKSNSNDKEILRSNIVVLDLDDSNLTNDEVSTEAAKQLAYDLINKLKKWAVLVIYTADNRSPVVNHLRQLNQEEPLPIEYVSANMKVTLMANVVEAAYVSHALKSGSITN